MRRGESVTRPRKTRHQCVGASRWRALSRSVVMRAGDIPCRPYTWIPRHCARHDSASLRPTGFRVIAPRQDSASLRPDTIPRHCARQDSASLRPTRFRVIAPRQDSASLRPTGFRVIASRHDTASLRPTTFRVIAPGTIPRHCARLDSASLRPYISGGWTDSARSTCEFWLSPLISVGISQARSSMKQSASAPWRQ